MNPVDLIIFNARITMLDDDRPTATALASGGGLVVAVGSDDEVLRLRSERTRVVDAQSAEEIRNITSVLTVVDGEVVYGAKNIHLLHRHCRCVSRLIADCSPR